VVELSFGQIEGILADQHDIASDKRTAFQARLKNFLRLGLPIGQKIGKGRPTNYSARDLLYLALVLEFAQIGLTPESAVRIVVDNGLPLMMATRFTVYWAEQGLVDERDVESDMFLYVVPNALRHLTNAGGDFDESASASFFYGSMPIIRQNLARLSVWPRRRVALINLTELIFDLSESFARDEWGRIPFLDDLYVWTRELEAEHGVEWSTDKSSLEELVDYALSYGSEEKHLAALGIELTDRASVVASLRSRSRSRYPMNPEEDVFHELLADAIVARAEAAEGLQRVKSS